LVHKALLVQHSAFFASALEHDWKESKSNLVEFPEDSIETFDLYIAWLYGRNPFPHVGQCECKGDRLTRLKNDHTLIDAWMLGDKLLDYDFRDMVVDSLFQHSDAINGWPAKTFIKIFKASAEDDPVHQMLVDVLLYDTSPDWIDISTFTVAAYKTIIRAFLKHGTQLKPEDAPWRHDPCVYHWHKKNGGSCYKEKKVAVTKGQWP